MISKKTSYKNNSVTNSTNTFCIHKYIKADLFGYSNSVILEVHILEHRALKWECKHDTRVFH